MGSRILLFVVEFQERDMHLLSGALSNGIVQIIALSVGVLFREPFGARLSSRLQGNWIIRSLAIALGIVGIRIFLMAF